MAALKLTPHRAGEAHYSGRIDDVTNQPFGPTTYRGWVIAVAQEYDAATDRTTVTFNHAEPVSA